MSPPCDFAVGISYNFSIFIEKASHDDAAIFVIFLLKRSILSNETF